MRFWLLLLGALMLASGTLAQDKATRSRPVTISDTEAARLLIANNRLDDARKLLEFILTARPEDSQAQFLMAMLEVAQANYDHAIALLRRILVREPDVERVRLELARAFFLKGDYDNADRQFRFARAGDIDDTVKVNIDRYLAAISRLRQWTVNFSLALAPDTNQNAATAASQISIFGLPFALSPNARRQSGVGVAADQQNGAMQRDDRGRARRQRDESGGHAAASSGGICTITWMRLTSLPSDSPKPPGSAKSRCMSMTISAVCAGSKA